MSSDAGPRPTSPPRPTRPTRPSFFVQHVDDDDDDFFHAPSPAPDDSQAALLTANTSESSHVSVPGPTDYYRLPTSFRNSYPGYPPILQSRPKNPVPPPSAFPDPRSDSPVSHSRRTSEDAHPRQRAALSEASRNSSAHSFAPPPLPWLNSASRTSSGSSTPNPVDGNPPRSTTKRKTFTSHLLKHPVPKPWLERSDKWASIGAWLTRAIFLVGVLAAAALCFLGFTGVERLGNVCLVMQDDFDSLDTNTWQREVELSGFGNGEFQWYTASDNNSFVDSGLLYIVPTLTSDLIGEKALFNGYNLSLPDCTAPNKTACTAASSNGASTVINPVQSARLTTRLSYSLQYGRVEVRAKMPQGDWLWPAIWMLPVNNTYGPWPMSGEIDIAESRGNAITYPAQGSNYISSALNWGPTLTINAWTKTWGWVTQRRASYADDFHTYALEWTDKFMRFYVDARTVSSLDLSFRKKSLFDLGDFPPIITEGAQQVVLTNPWEGRGNNAPFDQPFYLILNVAAGGTNGWFPDGVGNKPWVDKSASAMRDFAFHQNDWVATWPTDVRQRAMVVDSVKMWRTC